MVLHTYGSSDVKKVLGESEFKCGLEGYRLLTREYDPVSADISYALLERVLVIARWQVKTIEDEVGALREALKRVRELERRCPDTPDQRVMIAGMLFANVLSPAARKHVMSKSYPKGQDHSGNPIMIQARDDLEFMKMAIEDLKVLDEKARPQKMDVSALGEASEEQEFSHAEWQQWTEYCATCEDETGYENPSLDAIGGKSKGKGKKGKGKGKGKDKGKDTTRTAWVERRACHGCGVVGHILRDCPAAAKPKVSAVEESPPAQVLRANGTFVSFCVKRRPVGCSTDSNWRSVGAHGLATVDYRANACDNDFLKVDNVDSFYNDVLLPQLDTVLPHERRGFNFGVLRSCED